MKSGGLDGLKDGGDAGVLGRGAYKLGCGILIGEAFRFVGAYFTIFVPSVVRSFGLWVRFDTLSLLNYSGMEIARIYIFVQRWN